MTAHCSPRRPAPLYLIEANFGRRGRAFIETDRDQNSREHVIGLIRSGEVDPVKVLLIDEDNGGVCDVTADIMASVRFQDNVDTIGAVLNRQAAAFDHAHDTRKNWVS